MLIELAISHFAIIDKLNLTLVPGLNIFSGETGAGKSIVMKALGLLMGQKVASESLGSEEACVEGVFDVSQRPDVVERLGRLGIECEEESLMVRRVLGRESKSRIYLNNHSVTLSQLREVVAPLVEITGPVEPLIEMTLQHETKTLLSKNIHLEIVDRFAGHLPLLNRYSETYQQWQTLRTEISDIVREAQSREQRQDFLIFQRDEIKKVNPQPSEDNLLETSIRDQKKHYRFLKFVETVDQALYSGDEAVMSVFEKLLAEGEKLGAEDPDFKKRIEPIRQILVQAEDLVFELQKERQRFQVDPSALEEAEARLSQLRKLQKKYGPSLDQVVAFLQNVEGALAALEGAQTRVSELNLKVQELAKNLNEMADLLHQQRVAAGGELAVAVNRELVDLNMKGVSLVAQVSRLSEPQATGCSQVEFMIQVPGSPNLLPLAKHASGGELSRILLCLKQVVSASQYPRTYLFDEVDTGVSGKTAEKLGRKLKKIASQGQILCVTHLPQVASFGDAHFMIRKSTSGGAAPKVSVKQLNATERVKEIARLVSGERITQTSLEHARNLLAESSPDCL